MPLRSSRASLVYHSVVTVAPRGAVTFSGRETPAHRRRRSRDYAMWVDWFNTRRLLEPIGNIPPAEAEERYYAQLEEQAMAA
jgi:transposase InsO family protein